MSTHESEKPADILGDLLRITSPRPIIGQGEEGREMILDVPRRLSEDDYARITGFIEFQRRLSNQQFDNLLAQLEMHRDVLVESTLPPDPSASGDTP